MSGISLQAFRDVVSTCGSDLDQQIVVPDANKNELGIKNAQGEARLVCPGEKKLDHAIVREALLSAVEDSLGGKTSEAFQRVQTQLLGPLDKNGNIKGHEKLEKPLLARDIKAVLGTVDAVGNAKDFFGSNENRDLFDDIAATAYGKWEGKEGGNGYMAMGEDGAPLKFLTHSGERKNIGEGLSDTEKERVNTATARLQNQLSEMAKIFGDADFEKEVANLLKPEEKNGLNLLSRKSVAKVVDMIATKAKGIGITNLLNWDKIERADTLSNSTIGKVFGFDHEKLVAQAESQAIADMKQWIEKLTHDIADPTKQDNAEKNRAKLETAQKKLEILELVSDSAKLDAAAQRAKDKIDSADNDPTADKLLKPQGCENQKTGEGHAGDLKSKFKFVSTFTKASFDEHVKDQLKGFMQIFADGHFFGGGIASTWNSQEESTLSDLDLDMFAYFLKEGLVKKSVDPKVNNSFRFEYNQSNQFSTVNGGYTVNWKTREGKTCGLSFFSCPALAGAKTGFDVAGNIKWMAAARKKAGLPTLTKSQLRNATKYLKTIYDMQEKGELGYPVEKECEPFRQLLQLFMFKSDLCEFSHRSAAAIKNDIKKLLATNNKVMDENLDPESLEIRNASKDMNFKVMKDGYAKMIAAARESGCKVFCSGPSGLGEFFNEGRINARAFIEAWAEEGGDMTCIFSGLPESNVGASYFGEALDDYIAEHDAQASQTNPAPVDKQDGV